MAWMDPLQGGEHDLCLMGLNWLVPETVSNVLSPYLSVLLITTGPVSL